MCNALSPPRRIDYGLRDYGTATWEGGDAECDHKRPSQAPQEHVGSDGKTGTNNTNWDHRNEPSYADVCGKCGARRIDQQIGLEKTPAEFIAKLVDVFDEVRRVLRDDGTCWVNMGDTYAGAGFSGGTEPAISGTLVFNGQRGEGRAAFPGIKPKNLMGMPWRLAFALQDAGWILRQDIIWHKKSPMPESVTDRCTKAHEYIFLLAKSQRYFYDAEAIREPGSRFDWSVQKFKGGDLTTHHKSSTAAEALDPTAGRNCRSVWTFSTEPTKIKHFAAFPSALPVRCIKAGTSEKGCCAKCGAPWVRIVETERVATRSGNSSKTYVDPEGSPYEMHSGTIVGKRDPFRHTSVTKTTGWQPSCQCGVSAEIVPCTVLDCFSGTATTGMVATELGRIYIGCELSPEYAAASAKRIESWKFRGVEKSVEPASGQKELF